MATRLDNPRIAAALERLVRYRPGTGNEFSLSSKVVAVIDLLGLIGTSKTSQVTRNISSGAQVSAFTVPSGEIWRLMASNKALTVGTVWTEVQAASSGAPCPIAIPATAVTLTLLPDFAWLYPGDFISMTNGNVADTAINLNIWYLTFNSLV